jgi:tRNA threonylcarbamoyladenosine biosynthesis protein TsaE
VEIMLETPADLEAAMPKLQDALGIRRKVALYGDMGAGKTTLVNAFCTFLGVQDHTSSPTFSLINEYRYTDADGIPSFVHHLDLYRLNRIEELLDIGIEDLLDDPWYCFIEWPQLAEPLLPKDAVKIQLEILSETARRVLILEA